MRSIILGALALASLCASPALANDRLKVAIGGKGLGESEICEVGQNQGFFAKQGLDLDILYTAGSGETQQAVIGGSVDVGVATGLLGAIGAFAKGAPVRVIGASFTGDSNLFWYVRADSPIKTPREAAGRTVAYSTNGSSANNVVLRMQHYLGVAFQPTATGTGPATFTQVMTGQIDVGWSGAPFAVKDVDEGRIRVLWRASDVPALRDQTSRVIIANAQTLGARRDAIARFMQAYRDTIEWVYSSPEGVAAYARWAQVSEPVAKRTLDDFVTKSASNPNAINDLDGAMRAAMDFKFIAAPLGEAQVKAFVQIPTRS